MGERARKRERGKGEEIQKGVTEWRARERDIVRRFRNKKELLPDRQTDRQYTTHFPPAASMHGSTSSTSVFQTTGGGSAGDRERELPTSRGQAGKGGSRWMFLKSLLI